MNRSWLIFLLLIAFVPFFRGLVTFFLLFIVVSLMLTFAGILVGIFFPGRRLRPNLRSQSRSTGDSSLFDDEDAQDAEFKEKQ